MPGKHLLDVVDRKLTRKHRKLAEELLLVGAQKLPGVLHHADQAVLSVLTFALAPRKQLEAPVETVCQLVDGKLLELRRGELDGQGQTVEPGADGLDAGRVEQFPGGTVALGGEHEQLYRRRQAGLAAHRQRVDEHAQLISEIDRIATGRQKPGAAGVLQKVVQRRGHVVFDVLAVVEDEQHAAVAYRVGNLRAGFTCLHADAHHRGNCRIDAGAVAHGHEIHEPYAVRVVVLHGAAHGFGETGFAAAADAQQGHQPVVVERVDAAGEIVVSTNELGALVAEVAGAAGRHGPFAGRLGWPRRCLGWRYGPFAHRCDETEAAPVHGFDDALIASVVAEGFAQGFDLRGHRVLADEAMPPQLVQQLVTGYELIAVLDEVGQQRHHLGFQGYLGAVGAQRKRAEVQLELVEGIRRGGDRRCSAHVSFHVLSAGHASRIRLRSRRSATP